MTAIHTLSNELIDLEEPQISQLNLVDGAKALGRICRFNGHLSDEYDDLIYSVAQHSCYVHDFCEGWHGKPAAMWALLHDFLEHIYGDTITPLKTMFPGLSVLEDAAAARLRLQWGIPFSDQIEQAVHWADKMIGKAEFATLKGTDAYRQVYGSEPPMHMTDVDPFFACWSPKKAADEYIKRYNKLKEADRV